MERRILHFDMDAFFASVEQLDNPNFQGKPVVVGGVSGRGVVSTCSYEARKFGVHSAMPMFMARKKCPNGIFIPPRHHRYKEVSDKIFKIFKEYTSLIEKLSIDEAFLDVTGNRTPPLEIAKEIKRRVRNEIGLTVSVGISYNKFLAKLASDWKKPDGLFVITPDMVPQILLPLNINKVYGIGKKAVGKLNSLGVYTIKDLMTFDEKRLKYIFGKQGKEIYERIRGIDSRPVISHREVKSIGRETTLEKDTTNKDFLKEMLFEFSKEVSMALYKRNLYGKTVTVKVKTSSFKTITRSRTVESYLNGMHRIYEIGCEIIDEFPVHEPVRLIGISISNLTEHPVEQLSMFDNGSKRKKDIDKLVLEVNSKLGQNVLKFGKELEK